MSTSMWNRASIARIVTTVVIIVCCAAVAQAQKIVGDFSMSSVSGQAVVPVNGATGVPTSLQFATGLDFTTVIVGGVPQPTPGTPGQFRINSATGNFIPLVMTDGNIRDFTFAGPGSANYPNVPLAAFQSGQLGLVVDLNTISVDGQGSTFLSVSGYATFHMTGFEATPGTFVLTANASGRTFSFSASQGACIAAIGDFVWNDLDKDGIQENGEPGIPNILVQLWNAGHNNLLGAAATDSNGFYYFPAVCAGAYQVEVPVSQPGLVGWIASPTFVGGNPELDSNGNPYTVVLPTDVTQDYSIDFGYYYAPPLLKVEKTPKGGTFLSGSQISFQIKVSNDGGTPATNVHLTDQLPSDGFLQWISVTPAGYCTINGSNLLDCNLGTLQPASSITLTITSTLTTPLAACRFLDNPVALATADNNLSATDAGSLICSSTSLTLKSVYPSSAVPVGTQVTITVTETNTSGSPISNVSVTGTGCSPWTGGKSTLAPGESTEFSCTFTVTNNISWTATGHGKDMFGNDVPLDGETTSGKITVDVSAACLVISAIQGVPVSTGPMTGSGGAGGPYTFSAVGLPANLTMAADGSISGIPTVTGTFGYTITITDKDGNTGTTNCSLTVNGPPSANCVAINAIQGVAITPVTLTGSGGAGGPYTFTAVGLPAGLTMSSGGTISGTPTVTGLFSYTVTIKDKDGNTGTSTCSVKVNPPVSANCVAINAVQGVPITPVTLTATGGAGGPYTFTATGLPAGLTMSSGGTISGTPAVTGVFAYTVTIKDKDGNIGTMNCTVTVPPPDICVPGTFNLTGNSATTGTKGNIRLFTASNAIQVKTSAFTRTSGGAWSTAYLGSYSGGLGVTNNTENGSDPGHKVDNVGTVDYVLFEFATPVVINQAFLDSVTTDSDITVWIGTKTDPFNNHQTLSDAFLTSLGLTEENLTDGASSRWADLNGGGLQGNILVIAALASDTSPEDQFKIAKLDTSCPQQVPCSGVIGDFVWKDTNSNGLQDNGEPGIPGVTVQLKSGNTILATTTTNASGLYQFKNLCAGTYTVVIPTAPGGYTPSPSAVGSNRSVDSNGSPATVTLASNDSSDQTIDFGFVPPVQPCVVGTFTLTGNSSTDGPNGNIRLFTASNGIQVKASGFARTGGGAWSTAYLGSYGSGLGVTNNNEGNGADPTHKIDNVGTVDYVLFEFSSPVIISKAFLDAVTTDSDITVWIGNKTDPFNNHQTLSDAFLSGIGYTEKNETGSGASRWADFNGPGLLGNVLVIAALADDESPEDQFKISKLETACPGQECSGVIGNFVWKDTNANGIQDAGEPGLSGVTVQLKNGNTVIATTTTNASGQYQFTGICAGTYTVVLSTPAGYTASPSSIGSNKAIDSNGSPAAVTLAGNNSSDTTIDFGFVAGAPGQCVAGTLTLTGNSPSSGTVGNIRNFTLNSSVSVRVSAFSRAEAGGTWASAWLGSYGPGLGVTDTSEGDGGGGKHRVDNMGGRDNYVLFEFSKPVVVNQAFLDSIGEDSDISVWIGTKTDPYNNHQTLSDSFLNGLGFFEENLTAATDSSRWADINGANRVGNILVISALASDSSQEDEFKISKLDVRCQ